MNLLGMSYQLLCVTISRFELLHVLYRNGTFSLDALLMSTEICVLTVTDIYMHAYNFISKMVLRKK